MKCVNPIAILCVIVSFIFSQFPQMVQAADYYAAVSNSTQINETSPRVLMTPEEDMPRVEMKTTTKVLLGLLGVALIVGVAAAAAGGGGGGSSGGSDEPDTGSAEVGW